MSRGVVVLFPFAPLEELARRDVRVINERQLAHALGVHDTTVARFRRRGVPCWFADRICASLNVHPSEVWPDEYEAWVPRAKPRKSNPQVQARYRKKRRERERRAKNTQVADVRAELRAQQVAGDPFL